MNRILILKELEPFVYNKCFELYSTLYDYLKKIPELLGRAILKKYLRKNFKIEATFR